MPFLTPSEPSRTQTSSQSMDSPGAPGRAMLTGNWRLLQANRRAAFSPDLEPGRPFFSASSRSAATVTRAVAGYGWNAARPLVEIAAATATWPASISGRKACATAAQVSIPSPMMTHDARVGSPQTTEHPAVEPVSGAFALFFGSRGDPSLV